MRARQQSERVLQQLPKGVHEYRAALLSVFLHTEAQDGLSAMDPERQPLPLPAALDAIEELPEEYHEPARELAGCKLAKAILMENKQKFEPYFQRLVGLNSEEFKEGLRELLPQPPEGLQWVSDELLRQAFYGGYSQQVQGRVRRARLPRPSSSPARRGPSRGRQGTALMNLDQCFLQPEPPPPSQPQSTLNLTSLVTTVDIASTSNCSFASLANILDPRNWSLSPFWLASQEVRLGADKKDFSEPATPSSAPGESWSGILYEHVEWNWNLSNVAEFENLLKIQYEVDAAAQQLRMDFALYSCEGSQIYLLEQRGGVDVDSGFQCVAPLPSPSSPPGPSFRIRTLKNIRFTDLLDRQTPDQGPAGTGQFLSYLAPAVVGLWLNELIWRLYCTP